MPYKKPIRFFEDAGTVDASTSFHVNLSNVVNTRGDNLKTMVDLGRYFSIFAPRQSGKTTFFEDFCSELEKDFTYIPILLSFQNLKNVNAQVFYSQIQKDLYFQLKARLQHISCPQKDIVIKYLNSINLTDHISFYDFFITINRLINYKKIVIFIDEFDGIPELELENFLTSIRELYQKHKKKKEKALYSIGLVGIRNITKLIVGGVSPFNIADQIKLPAFTIENLYDLYNQYSRETNQFFTKEAVEKIYQKTAGQPWLVNRLGMIITVNVKPKTVAPITVDDVDDAIDILIYEENSHFDNITQKAEQYRETFIDIVFDGVKYLPGNKEQSLLLTHGLIKEKNKKAVVANPIYKQRFLKTFFQEVEQFVDIAARRYLYPDNTLNMEKILSDFEKYIIQIGVSAFYSTKNPMEVTGKFQLTAWLYQFVSNGTGQLRYESRTGLGIMDILLNYGNKKYIIETKINRYTGTIDDALEQLTERYLLPEKVDYGYIVMFDPKIIVGNICTPQLYKLNGKNVLSFTIGIGIGRD